MNMAVLLLALGFLLGMDRLPLPGVASVAPAAPFLALYIFAFGGMQIRRNWRELTSTTVGRAVHIFLAFVLVHSVVMLVVDLIAGQPDPTQATVDWARQVGAVGAGYVVYVVFSRLLTRVGASTATRWIVTGALPIAALSILQVLYWQFDWAWADVLPNAVRSALDLPRIVNRVTGLAVEPLSYAGWVATFVLPLTALALYSAKLWGRDWWIYLAGTVLFATGLIFTLSGTTFLLLIPALCGSVVLLTIFRVSVKWAMLSALLMILGVVLTTLFLPDVYAIQVLQEHSSATGGNWWDLLRFVKHLDSSPIGTISTKAGSTLDPLLHTFDSRVWLGYGLGGSARHAGEFLSDTTVAGMQSVAGGGFFTLKTLFGRVWAETGIVGAVLALWVLGTAFWKAGRMGQQFKGRNTGPDADHYLLTAARIGLLVTVGASLGTIGSYALPYLWLWLAVVESYELKTKAGRRGQHD